MSAEGAQAQTKRMEVLANNLANINTVGFKRDQTLFQARFAEAIQQGSVSPGMGGREDMGGGIEVAGTVTDFTQGPLKVTGVPTDVAITGEGFFQVKKGNETLLTRAGDFQIDNNGLLRTQAGYPVLSETGGEITVAPGVPWTMAEDGAIHQEGSRIPLAMVRPESLGDMVKLGDNLFKPLAPVRPIPLADRHLKNEALEMSGLNPTSAMVELIETSRAAEINMKLIQNQDNMMGSLISRILAN
jgi:flagellar basal-body rod protein FlgF/flagellar basal-body rod protein FlgG